MRTPIRVIAPLLVAGIAFFTYVRHYDQPNNFFWDENYYVAAAQKYLNGVFFMEAHPPLGKLFIAAGEKLLHPNPETNQYLDTDYARDASHGMSFSGFRLFPVICAWLVAILVYFIFLEITGQPLWALLLSSLYLFDNALIVHFRGAMLDGIQLLFIAATLLIILRMRNGKRGTVRTILAGVMFACAVMVKENGALVAPALLLPLWSFPRGLAIRARYLATLTAAGAIAALSVWWIAFALGPNINPALEHFGWYSASPELKAEVQSNSLSPIALYYYIRDSVRYSKDYVAKVPKLNYCKLDENGSYPLFWPVGGRSINYRWQKNREKIAFLYLQINPATWAIALASILCAGALCVTRVMGQRKSKLAHEDLIYLFTGMYVLYAAAALSVDRVLYLYHYFVPLLYCFVLCAILATDLAPSVSASTKKTIALSSMTGIVILAFIFFAPFTYYIPLTEAQFYRRSLLPLWDLTWVDRARLDPIGRTLVADEPHHQKPTSLELSGIKSTALYQEWGLAHMNSTVDGNPLSVGGIVYPQGFGVHASSSVEFPLNREFSKFTALVGVPDEVTVSTASVQFAIQGDGKELWHSEKLRPGDAAVAVEVNVHGVLNLSLLVTPGGETNENDHACWLAPKLVK